MKPEAPVTKQFIAESIERTSSKEKLFLRLIHGGDKVADYQSAIQPIANRRYRVTQIGNLLYRRLATGPQTRLLDFGPRLGNNLSRCMPRKRSARSKRLSRKEVRELDIKISFFEGIVRRD